MGKLIPEENLLGEGESGKSIIASSESAGFRSVEGCPPQMEAIYPQQIGSQFDRERSQNLSEISSFGPAFSLSPVQFSFPQKTTDGDDSGILEERSDRTCPSGGTGGPISIAILEEKQKTSLDP